MITFTQKGDFSKITNYLKKQEGIGKKTSVLDYYGQLGLNALREATPKDSGLTASSWSYNAVVTNTGLTITWSNNNFNKGVPIAIIIQYGHGTGTGGWVEGRDYINPAMRPVFDKIAEDLWKEMTEV